MTSILADALCCLWTVVGMLNMLMFTLLVYSCVGRPPPSKVMQTSCVLKMF